jgi:hypothetical protein
MEESMEAVRRVQAHLQMGSKCSYTIFEQHENKIVMWGLHSNQLGMIKWKGIILLLSWSSSNPISYTGLK